MKKTFQSFVFGCRVNEAERIKMDKELVEAGFSVDLASPSFLVINTCAITGKAEREAKQLIYQLRKEHPEAKIVITGCSSTLWKKYLTGDDKLADIVVPNEQKNSLVDLLLSQSGKGPTMSASPDLPVSEAVGDKFRHSNRLLVKIQDGCHRFCAYCIVPYLRGLPQSERIQNIIKYINSFVPVPSEVVLSAINTEAFGKDTTETLTDLIAHVLRDTTVPRIAFGSIHPWSITNEYIRYYQNTLADEKRFIHFFHVPIQSGSQPILQLMKREYNIKDVIEKLSLIKKINANAFIATDVIVGYLGETDAFFEETYTLLEKSPISRFHVFRFSNRPHTAAFYLKKEFTEPSMEKKKQRSDRLIALSKKKYQIFIETQVGRSCMALVIAKHENGFRVLLDNHVEGILPTKHSLPGERVRVTILTAKDGYVVCKES